MDIKTAIAQVIEKVDLSQEQMVAVMRQIMTGEASPEQIAGFLVALRMKGESLDEITGAVMVMRELASGVSVSGEHLVDIVGTGGDGASLFNVSTASAFVVAVSGGRVVKHGNRSVSSKSGSADLLEAAGVRLDLNSAQVARCVESEGIGFMFAPQHHSAMKYAAGPRKALGVRTLFNILGPMTNPAGVKRQLIGVFDAALCLSLIHI
ncbi:MAG: anthranilate phosphoribosyltransferase [Gammaproteobacteria bacterium]|nr:anthranilate phosphoribosyltransferase [Gammaproteobacteria bacterium]